MWLTIAFYVCTQLGILVYQEYLYNNKINKLLEKDEYENQLPMDNPKPIIYSIEALRSMKFNKFQASGVVEYTNADSDNIVSVVVEIHKLPKFSYHESKSFYQTLGRVVTSLNLKDRYVLGCEEMTMKVLNIFKLRTFVRCDLPHGEAEHLLDTVLGVVQTLLTKPVRSEKLNISLANLVLELIYFSTPSLILAKRNKIYDTLLMLKTNNTSIPENFSGAVKSIYMLLTCILCEEGERHSLIEFLQETGKHGGNVYIRSWALSLLNAI